MVPIARLTQNAKRLGCTRIKIDTCLSLFCQPNVPFIAVSLIMIHTIYFYLFNYLFVLIYTFFVEQKEFVRRQSYIVHCFCLIF